MKVAELLPVIVYLITLKSKKNKWNGTSLEGLEVLLLVGSSARVFPASLS